MKFKSDVMLDLHQPKRLVSGSSAYDVITVGAGLQGCATALNLVLRKQRVLVLEKKTAGRGASGVNAGGVRRLNMTTERIIIDFKELMISAQTVTDVFPIMQSVPVVRCWAGIEGIMPDQIPVIGPSPSAPGIFHAFGFSAHGFQLGPIVGKIMAGLVTEGRTEFPIEPFRADRFTSE